MPITRFIIEGGLSVRDERATAERPGLECPIGSVIEWLNDLSCVRRTPLRNFFM
jgi:hypothetical protein